MSDAVSSFRVGAGYRPQATGYRFERSLSLLKPEARSLKPLAHEMIRAAEISLEDSN